MKKILTLTIAIVVFFSSCSKEQFKEAVSNTLANSNITFGFPIAGSYIQLSIGGGQGLYWDQPYYDSYNYNTNWTTVTTVGYILNKPSNSESIMVFDKFNRIIGTVRCDQGQGATTNEVFLRIRNWFDQNPNGKCAAPITYPLIPFTRGGEWKGTINL